MSNTVRKFIIFMLFLFILNGITNIVNNQGYFYLFLGIIQTLTGIIGVISLFLKKD